MIQMNPSALPAIQALSLEHRPPKKVFKQEPNFEQQNQSRFLFYLQFQCPTTPWCRTSIEHWHHLNFNNFIQISIQDFNLRFSLSFFVVVAGRFCSTIYQLSFPINHTRTKPLGHSQSNIALNQTREQLMCTSKSDDF